MSFNPAHSEINQSLTLLEASAGTGKTYSLVRLIARHIVEHQIPLEKILTVTFTRAATAEIKVRLHHLLHETLYGLKQNKPEYNNDLSEKWASQGEEFKQNALKSLTIALANFDAVPIFTIDGFYQRLLKEYSFESGSLFKMELDTNESEMVDQALRDYWRTKVYTMKKEEYQFFIKYISFDSAAQFINEVLRSPDATLSESYNQAITELVKKERQRVSAFKNSLLFYKEEIIHFVQNPPKEIAKRRKPFRAGGAKIFEQELQQFFDGGSSACLENLSSDYLYSPVATTKALKNPLNEHSLAPVFEAISLFLNHPPPDLKSAYLGDILKFVRTSLDTIKTERNVHTYTDITTKLANLLNSDSRPAQLMVSAVRSNYSAALIDEFQDTSPQQCSVFLSLFNHAQGYFHIIGDPKQSIYRFRGADVYAYIKASEKAETTERLKTNYRSTPSMVHAVNQVFQCSEDPFLVDQKIQFHPSKWDEEKLPLSETPSDLSLHLHYLNPTDKDTSTAIEANICTEVVKLLGEDWTHIQPSDTSRTKAIEPSDIAILVSSKSEGQRLFNSLTSYGIPTIIQTRTSLLETEEASEFLTILRAALNPNNSGLVRSALLSTILGSGIILIDEKRFIKASETFTEIHDIWNQKGLTPMISHLFETFEIQKSLLSQIQGLRSVTNLMHLSELIDSKSRAENFTPVDCIRWLEMAIKGNVLDSDAEVLELRLDTDQAAVKILTQHSSKGLEFPIVFVTPTCRQNFSRIKPDLSYHEQDTLKTIIAGQGDTNEAISSQRTLEACADRARLTYVSLTRAKYICHFYYIPEEPEKAKEHAVSQMLGEPSLESLLDLSHRSNGCISVKELSSTEWPSEIYHPSILAENTTLAHRDINQAEISSNNRTTSFSGLTYQNHSEESYRDIDRSIIKAPAETTSDFWNELQAGASLGSAFHEILEEINFTDLIDPESLIRQKLKHFQPWRSAPSEKSLTKIVKDIAAYLHQLVDNSLETTDSFRLSDIPLSKRIIEPEFFLSNGTYSIQQLADILKSSPPKGLPAGYINQLSNLEEELFQGFLTGFIDLIFEHQGKYHILDWKTNKLNDYSTNELCEAMAEHHYYLQYHLYSLALDRFLRHRLGSTYDPALHLGKVYYVFLRGVVEHTPGSGIFCDDISIDRLNKLRSTFISIKS